MKAIMLEAPGGLDNLRNVTLPDPGEPGRGEIRVRLHASSLNYHDYRVLRLKLEDINDLDSDLEADGAYAAATFHF